MFKYKIKTQIRGVFYWVESLGISLSVSRNRRDGVVLTAENSDAAEAYVAELSSCGNPYYMDAEF